MRTAILGLSMLALVGCGNEPPATVAPPATAIKAAPPAPFRVEDNVVPAQLDPDRPHPPPPSTAEVARVRRTP